MVTLWNGNYKLCRFWTNLFSLGTEEKLRLHENNIYDRAEILWNGQKIVYTAGTLIPKITP